MSGYDILKKYSTEVSFIDGSTEFKSYIRSSELVEITEDLLLKSNISFEITLQYKEIVEDSIIITIRDKYDTPVYFKSVVNKDTNVKEIYLNDNNIFVLGDIIEVEYSALNESISDLYSVDYEEGILYLAAEPNKDLEVVYDSYNILVDAKKAIQLEDEEYTVTDLTGNSTNGVSSTINNFKNNIEYEAIYSVEKESKDLYRTPIITNVKLNYINVSEQESLWVVLIKHF